MRMDLLSSPRQYPMQLSKLPVLKLVPNRLITVDVTFLVYDSHRFDDSTIIVMINTIIWAIFHD